MVMVNIIRLRNGITCIWKVTDTKNDFIHYFRKLTKEPRLQIKLYQNFWSLNSNANFINLEIVSRGAFAGAQMKVPVDK